jgi:hypothetical protein
VDGNLEPQLELLTGEYDVIEGSDLQNTQSHGLMVMISRSHLCELQSRDLAHPSSEKVPGSIPGVTKFKIIFPFLFFIFVLYWYIFYI